MMRTRPKLLLPAPPAHRLAFPLGIGALLLSGCGDLRLTAPIPQHKTLYMVTDPRVLDACGTVALSGDPVQKPFPFSFGKSIYVYDAAPHHTGLQVNGFPRSEIAADEGVIDQKVQLKRAGAYVYESSVADGAVYSWTLTCTKTSKTYRQVVSGTFSNPGKTGGGPAVFRVVQNTSGNLSATLQEFPRNATPEQLQLP